MSYNIDTFKVKRLVDLEIPFADLIACKYCNVENEDDGSTTVSYGEFCTIKGRLAGAMLYVESIDWYGEGSGNNMYNILEPALQKSTGELIVSLVWEGGDSVNQLIVNNGNVIWRNIDI